MIEVIAVQYREMLPVEDVFPDALDPGSNLPRAGRPSFREGATCRLSRSMFSAGSLVQSGSQMRLFVCAGHVNSERRIYEGQNRNRTCGHSRLLSGPSGRRAAQGPPRGGFISS
jgi:hypothetical protein